MSWSFSAANLFRTHSILILQFTIRNHSLIWESLTRLEFYYISHDQKKFHVFQIYLSICNTIGWRFSINFSISNITLSQFFLYIYPIVDAENFNRRWTHATYDRIFWKIRASMNVRFSKCKVLEMENHNCVEWEE